MKSQNDAVDEAVHRAVDDAVNVAVDDAVNVAVNNAVYRAVDEAVDEAVYWAVGVAVRRATVEDPDPVLGDFLLDLKPESDRAPRQMEAVSRGLGGRRTPNSEKSSPTRW